MTKLKVMFTEENWTRHMSASTFFLMTARSKRKCGVWYSQRFPDGNLWVCTSIKEYPVDDYIHQFWEMEGFKSEEEFRDELTRIYGTELKTVYAHEFTMLRGVVD